MTGNVLELMSDTKVQVLDLSRPNMMKVRHVTFKV